MKRWLTRSFFITLLLLCVGGCCHYSNADHDLGVPALLGHRCILTQPASFPEGGMHWLPTIDPPAPYPLVRLDQGTILRVAHVEAWSGPLIPGGTTVYADVENGPNRGHSVVIGNLDFTRSWIPPQAGIYVGPPGGVPVEAAHSIRPFNQEDAGIFYTGEYHPHAGMVTNLAPIP